MLTSNHPHAWNVAHADEHLDPKFRHHHVPAGGHLVVTPQMKLLAGVLPPALDRGAAIAVSGPYGAGKSTTLAALTAVADVNTAVVDMPAALTVRQQWEAITTAITGQPATGTARTLQNDAREYLTAVPTLLIVDEAQFIGTGALLQLRWLWGNHFPRFAIVLAGSNLFAKLDAEPSVGTRIDRRISLRHHTTGRMLELLREHHPQLADTDPHLLTQVDETYAHGSWRAWSLLMLSVANDLRHNGPLTPTVLAAAIQSVTGEPAALVPAGVRR